MPIKICPVYNHDNSLLQIVGQISHWRLVLKIFFKLIHPTVFSMVIFLLTTRKIFIIGANTVADPGFPVGGGATRWGVPTSDAYTFWQKLMGKRKKWILLGGGGAGGAPPGSANVIVKMTNHVHLSITCNLTWIFVWLNYVTFGFDVICSPVAMESSVILVTVVVI